ncbi:MAG: hypothetical protein ACRC6T_15830 [Sarcina sp.]
MFILILYAYRLEILLTIVALITLRKTIYHKSIWGKILFWGIVTIAFFYALAVILVAVAATAIAPSFVEG